AEGGAAGSAMTLSPDPRRALPFALERPAQVPGSDAVAFRCLSPALGGAKLFLEMHPRENRFQLGVHLSARSVFHLLRIKDESIEMWTPIWLQDNRMDALEESVDPESLPARSGPLA